MSKVKPDPTELVLIAQVISSEQMKEVEEEDMESIIEHHMEELGERMEAMEDRLTEYMDESMQHLAMTFSAKLEES